MRVFIVGGTGLLGRDIVRRLVDAGHDVTSLQRGETDGSLPEEVTRVTGDRGDDAALRAAVRDADPSVVVDLACFDADAARSAVEICEGVVDRYVFCSTIDVYHRPPPKNPVSESSPRNPPVSDYAAGKIAAEDVFFDAHEAGDFDVVVLRPWNTYGEGGTLVHTFGMGSYYVDRIRAGKPIVVHGDGTSLWGPCHTEDVARAFCGAVERPGVGGRAYNVTSEETMTWNQYHRRVASALNAPEPDLVHIPTDVLRQVAPERTRMLRDHFQYSTVFDNSRAIADLGFRYTVDFETGVRRTVDWLDDHDAVERWETEPLDDTLVAAWTDATDSFVESFEDAN
ncbi:NAD-dependent epimerase/dehydratase family protein [Haloferax sp. MBLA0076]|uniref:NAD-dependent epimerase/dehydratase family protein n=1 Tax=Haloferax litoreum TaxID=2666140 RepID=A0A6A8GF97_9EURY|nr:MULTISPECIES: NAD-dependent epimerase/dehydratase family protein [Haloferax]KAB1193332.1 NAD-dependent epimerase/dehydratase family protein [Haloferax sp. CBA1148]MRX21838.1 NAD-dependent epimerase/dehydratase family protein [Haloferax litoreum]